MLFSIQTFISKRQLIATIIFSSIMLIISTQALSAQENKGSQTPTPIPNSKSEKTSAPVTKVLPLHIVSPNTRKLKADSETKELQESKTPIEIPIKTLSPIDSPKPTPIPIALPTPIATPKPTDSSNSTLEKKFIKNILKDQYQIWTSPFRLNKNDARWFVPLSATTVILLATDRQTATAIGDDPNGLPSSREISRFGSGYAVSGVAATFYIIGRVTKNPRARETGILATQAFINTAIVTQTLKISTGRLRPFQSNGRVKFFENGRSFPSGHSSGIWSLAAVIDGQYGKRHPIVRYGVFGLATAVSISRFTGRKHFLSDTLIGGAIGYGIGRFVFNKYHDKTLDSSDETTKVTKFEKYFPLITPQYNARNQIYGANLTWNF